MLACVFFWGGFFDFSAIAMGALFAILLVVMIGQKRELILPQKVILYSALLFGLSAIIAGIAAFDKGSAFIGILRILSVMMFGLLWWNLSSDDRQETFQAITFSGVCINLLSVFAWFIPDARSYFFSAGRLWGSMQYANTWALFLLIGMIIIFSKEKITRTEWLEAVILMAGILMTGSRSVFVLTILFGGWALLKSKSDKRMKGIAIGVAVLLLVVIQMIMKLDMTRLFEISLNSSTLNGRLLYWQDAIHLIARHPMGIGYMNYYFIQPQIQTGYYFSKNVHNDLLQLMLDDGMLAAIVLVFLAIYGLRSKKNSDQQKRILLVLILHSLFDFDLEFLTMTCIFIMCLPIEEKWKKLPMKIAGGLEGAMGCLGLYFAIALGAYYYGNIHLSLAMYPYNTMARWELLSEKKDISYPAAERIIRENGMIAAAWEVMLQEAVEQNAYADVVKDEQEMLKCAGYDLDYYNQAVLSLSHALDNALRSGDMENGQMILTEIQNIPDEIEQLRSRTSEIAWKLYEKPSFDLDENVQDYIQKLEGIQLQ